MPAAAKKSLTKSQLTSDIAERAGLSKAQVNGVFDALSDTVAAELKKGAAVSVPGLVKISATHKKATPARPGRNPFTGEAITIKAKPARKAVKVRPVKALKDVL